MREMKIGYIKNTKRLSREFKLLCVVGTKVATRVVQTGDWLEVDANKGIIKIIN
jgi:hypothetical protein